MGKKTNPERLSNKTLVGYGFGAFADAAAYNFAMMFMLFFLTSMAGLSAVRAGFIISSAIVVQAVYALIIGPVSDNMKNRFGRRRPYIFVGVLMMSVSIVMVLRVVNMGETGSFIYYQIMILLFWIGYTTFINPYNALGSEITTDYDDRTRLRTLASIFNCLGNVVGMALPLAFVAMLVDAGASEKSSWSVFGVFLASLCFITVMVTLKMTKGKELSPEEVFTEQREKNHLKSYVQIAKLKPFKWIAAFGVVFYIGYVVCESGVIYFVLHCAKLTETQMSTAMGINIGIGIFVTLAISYVSTKLDKNKGIIICFLFSAVGMTTFYFIGVNSLAMLTVFMFVYNVGNLAFWLLLYSIIYDLSEVYEYKYGERKEGSILGLLEFIFTLASALGTQVLTISLTLVGYDSHAEVQSAATSDGIALIVCGIPVLAYILGALCCFGNPITKKTYKKLLTQLEKKRAGEPIDESGLERVI